MKGEVRAFAYSGIQLVSMCRKRWSWRNHHLAAITVQTTSRNHQWMLHLRGNLDELGYINGLKVSP